MISKSQLKKVLFINNNIREKELFISNLFRDLDLYLNSKISKEQFNTWLDSWVAAAELDQDPKAAERIKKGFNEIREKRAPHKNWKEFKNSLGIS